MTQKSDKSAAYAIARARHRKRQSTYDVFTFNGTLQTSRPLEDGAALTFYRCETDGRWWARPPGEFSDGRFEVNYK